MGTKPNPAGGVPKRKMGRAPLLRRLPPPLQMQEERRLLHRLPIQRLLANRDRPQATVPLIARRLVHRGREYSARMRLNRALTESPARPPVLARLEKVGPGQRPGPLRRAATRLGGQSGHPFQGMTRVKRPLHRLKLEASPDLRRDPRPGNKRTPARLLAARLLRARPKGGCLAGQRLRVGEAFGRLSDLHRESERRRRRGRMLIRQASRPQQRDLKPLPRQRRQSRNMSSCPAC